MENVIEKLKAEVKWYSNGYKKFKDQPFPESQKLAKDCQAKMREFKEAIKILNEHK